MASKNFVSNDKKDVILQFESMDAMAQKKHSIRRLNRFLLLTAGIVAMLCAPVATLRAQQVVRNGVELVRFDSDDLVIDFNLSDFNYSPLDGGMLLLTSPATNSYSHRAGAPQLPLWQQLVELPDSVTSIVVEQAEWQQHALPATGMMLAPAAPTRLKSMPPEAVQPDITIYGNNAPYGLPLATLTPLGSMRGTRLGRLTISPFRYNAVEGTIECCHHCRISIRFGHNGATAHAAAQSNPLLAGLPLLCAEAPRTGAKAYLNGMASADEAPVLMVVMPQAYEEAMQPLLHWKRQEGYVVETYLCDGQSREAIQEFLQQRYDAATVLHPAPQALMLVGDIDHIPVWMGRHTVAGLDFHRTDLYYAEYTGDYLPDVLLGRLSVDDTAELRAVVAKTLAYERYELADTAYLGRSLLVAGKEETPPAPTVTNGQVNYLKQCLMAHDPEHDTFCYYNPASDTLVDTLLQRLRQGVGLVSYTAHCNINGWRHPMLYSSDIDTLTSPYHYFLAINNCCRTNEIIGTCFGEHLLRKADGGAIGAVGASNETLWEEDYYWAVGCGATPTDTPSYHAAQLGAYDRLLHTHQEPAVLHAPCQGQLPHAGNWAVTASGSTHDAFYWEIYSLLGDPTLMPYIGTPAAQLLTADPVHMGDNLLTLHGTPGARVAATRGDTLYGLCLIDSTGLGLLHCRHAVVDSLTLTATAQFHKPLQTVTVPQPFAGARLVATEAYLVGSDGDTIDHIALGDSALLGVRLRNVGSDTAVQHHLHIAATHDDADALSCDVARLAPLQDTLVWLLMHPTTERDPAVVALLCETGEADNYWSQTLRFDLLPADTTDDPNVGIANEPPTARPADDPYLIYPNPAGSQVTLSGFERPTHVELYDALGRCHATIDASAGETHTIDTSHLADGVYSLRFVSLRPDGSLHQCAKRLLINP